MSPTYELRPAVLREYRRLDPQMQRAFDRARREFVEALRSTPPIFPSRLRVKRVQGHADIWELTFAPDGRATFEYGQERERGEPHVVWRRVAPTRFSIVRDDGGATGRP